MSVVEQFVARKRALGWRADPQNQEFIAGNHENRSILLAATRLEEKLAKLLIDQRVFRSERALLGM